MNFLWAVIGALFIYLLNLRVSRRFRLFILHPKENWRMLLFDIIIFLLLSGVFVYIVIEPATRKEAFMAGVTWEASASSLFETMIIKKEIGIKEVKNA